MFGLPRRPVLASRSFCTMWRPLVPRRTSEWLESSSIERQQNDRETDVPAFWWLMSDGTGGRRLGRGLKALISVPDEVPSGGDLLRIPISRIRSNPFQPRKTFDPKELAELEASLASSGLLQPIAVRRAGDAYELIAGERRLRAATNLGWTEIPAVIKDLDNRSSLVMALVENLQ